MLDNFEDVNGCASESRDPSNQSLGEVRPIISKGAKDGNQGSKQRAREEARRTECTRQYFCFIRRVISSRYLVRR
jgi:hypothetical protein